MAFAEDRDLAVVEPGLFQRVQWLGQRLSTGTGTAALGGLNATDAQPDFVLGEVRAGHVVVIGGSTLEVIDREDGTTLFVSQLRANRSAAAQRVGPSVTGPFSVWTFEPQLDVVHGQVLRMLGLRRVGAEGEGPSEADVRNVDDLRPLECFGALHLIFAAASAGLGATSEEHERSERYRRLFEKERQRVHAEIDTDGDGVADVVRRPNVVRMVRG